MEPVTIPKYVDDPITLLVWSADEFVPAVLMLMLGMFIGQLTITLLLSLVVIKFYRRFRDNRPDGYPLHAGYSTGVVFGKATSITNPFIREYLP
jgi:conjugal transfer pilus assembly protein TraL